MCSGRGGRAQDQSTEASLVLHGHRSGNVFASMQAHLTVGEGIGVDQTESEAPVRMAEPDTIPLGDLGVKVPVAQSGGASSEL